MYKLLIVDDEKDICDGLTNIVNWSEIGYKVAASLEDGKNAIEYINSNKVDVILTDIKMNYKSGLDLAKYVYEHNPEIKVVILSGFREFELAQTAIKYGVKNYLLKPTNFKELHTQFRDLKNDLDEQKIKSEKLREQNAEMVHALKEQFFTDLTGGSINSVQEINRRVNLTGYKAAIKENRCSVIQLKVKDCTRFPEDGRGIGKKELNTMLRNVFCGENSELTYFLYKSHEDTLDLFIAENEQSDAEIYPEKISSFLCRTTHSAEALLGIHIEQNTSKTYNNCCDLVNGQAHIIPAKSVETKVIRSVKKYIETHFAEDVSLEDAADHVNLNYVYLSRLFKQETGENFTDYLTSIRIEKAKELLSETHQKGCKICEKIGYRNPKYFYKIFKKRTGFTTSEYRAKHW